MLNDRPLRSVGKTELFLGFLKIGLMGFGGVAPWARYVIVEERKWLTDKEFAELLGVGQILPGPNTVNASVIIGDRFQGPVGVLLCLLGQMAMPVVIVMALAVVYEHLSNVPEVRAALIGVAEQPSEPRHRSCNTCRLAGSCAYRKEGSHCEQA